MACGSKEAGGVYRPRRPQQSPFYHLVERRLLGELCRAAARTVITVYRAASGRPRHERPAKAVRSQNPVSRPMFSGCNESLHASSKW